MTVHVTDFANNETQATVKFNTYPAEFNPVLSTLTLDTSVGSSFSKYADNSSIYKYILETFGYIWKSDIWKTNYSTQSRLRNYFWMQDYQNRYGDSTDIMTRCSDRKWIYWDFF